MPVESPLQQKDVCGEHEVGRDLSEPIGDTLFVVVS